MASIAILVLNFNGKEYLQECFDSLEKLSSSQHTVETYCVDNASTDGSVEWVKEHFPWVKILAFDHNWGFAGAYNRAVRQIVSDYVVFLNNDTVVDPEWLNELVKAAEQRDDAVIFGSKLLFYDRPNVVNHAGGKITLIGSGYDIGMGCVDDGRFDLPSYTGWSIAASLLMRREVFLQVGGFDEDYFAYFDDVDLCWRTWLAGYRVLYVPASVVYHKYGGSFGNRRSSLRIYHCLKNRVANMIKNLKWPYLLLGLGISVGYEAYRVLIFLSEKNWAAVAAVARGSWACIRELPASLAKRRVIQRHRKLSDAQLMQMGLVSSLMEAYRSFRRIESLDV